MEERTARLTGVTDADSGRVLRGREGCKVPSRAKTGSRAWEMSHESSAKGAEESRGGPERPKKPQR